MSPAMDPTKTTVSPAMLPNSVNSLSTKNVYAKPAISNSCLPLKPAQSVIILVKLATTAQLALLAVQLTSDSKMPPTNVSA